MATDEVIENLQAMIEDLVLRGSDDWVALTEVAGVVKFIGGVKGDEEIRRVSLEVIRQLVLTGRAEVGEVKENVGFQNWVLGLDEAIAEIERRWDSAAPPYQWAYSSWLRTTPAAKAEAERIFAARESK